MLENFKSLVCSEHYSDAYSQSLYVMLEQVTVWFMTW